MAELLDLHKEFHLGNKFTLTFAEKLAELLPDKFRVIVKYDLQETPVFDDGLLNLIVATSRETHSIPNDFFRNDIYAILQNYFMLDKWGDPIYNPLAYPMPIGTFVDFDDMPEIKPLPERKYDFSFVGQIPHTGTRDCFKRNLDNLIKETGDKFNYFVEYTDGFNQGLSKKEYLDLLNDSKIVLCPCGAYSQETFRFFEVIKMGAFPMVENLPRLWYYESAPFFRSKWHELDKRLSQALNFLGSPSCRDMLYSLASYNQTILDESALANHMVSQLTKRDSNDPTALARSLEEIRSIAKEYV